MSNIPDDLTYTEEHEWFKSEGEVALVGITDHAQDQLGDVVFLELPEVGTSISKGDAFGVVESVKAVSDLFAPFDGEVVEVNQDLVDTPEKINTAPYDSWLIKVKPSGEVSGMNAAEYQTLVEREA